MGAGPPPPRWGGRGGATAPPRWGLGRSPKKIRKSGSHVAIFSWKTNTPSNVLPPLFFFFFPFSILLLFPLSSLPFLFFLVPFPSIKSPHLPRRTSPSPSCSLRYRKGGPCPPACPQGPILCRPVPPKTGRLRAGLRVRQVLLFLLRLLPIIILSPCTAACRRRTMTAPRPLYSLAHCLTDGNL